MKTEFVDLSETRKNLVVEIPSSVVEGAIERLARKYSRAARIPGFRPGKVPPRIARQRFRDQILHDVAHELIPKAVDEALRERGLEPVATPDITDVVLEQGQPLRFTASFETLPPVDPGDYTNLLLRKIPARVDEAEVEESLDRLRARAARYEPVSDRAVDRADVVTLSMDRRALSGPEAGGAPVHQEDVTVELGAPANPPGFDGHLLGLGTGESRTFTLRYPDDYPAAHLAGAEIEYSVTAKEIKRRLLPELDNEFAKDLEFESLDALRSRVREDLQRQAEQESMHKLRTDLLHELASRVTIPVPEALVERELDRRVEDLARRLLEQRIDPRKTEIDWPAFREGQRQAAAEAVRSTLVLDEVARREALVTTQDDLDREIERYAERAGRTPTALKAQLEREDGVARLAAGLRREKTIDFLLSRATIATE